MNRSRGKYDIVLTSAEIRMGFNLAHELTRGGLPAKPAVVSSEIGPSRLDEVVRNADLPRVIDNLDAGMGFTRRIEAVPNGYSYCAPGYTRSPGAIFSPAGKVTEIPLPSSGWMANPITESHLFDGNIYLINQGRNVLELPGGDGPAVVVADGGVTWRGHGAAVFNKKLYVGGAFGGLMHRSIGGAWSAPAIDVPRKFPRSVSWRPQGIPTEVLVAVDPSVDEGARWCPITADPMLPGSWSAPVSVGADRDYVVQAVVAAPRHVFFLRPDGLYDIDELGVRAFNVAPWIDENRDGLNGSWGMAVGDGVYYAHSQGLAYIPTTGETQYRPQFVHPGWGLPYEAPVMGVVTAGTLHDGWLLVALFDHRKSYICAGMPDENAYGRATHVWHGAEAVVEGMVTHMKVHTTGDASGWPRLLIATSDNATPVPTIRLYWQSLSKVGSPLAAILLGFGGAAAFEPAEAATLYLPTDAWNRPSAVTTLLEIDLVTDRLVEDQDYLRVLAAADTGAYEDQGLADDGVYTSLRPVQPVTGRYIKTRVDAVGHPVLRALELRAAVSPEVREARVYRVILAEDNGLKTARGRETGDPDGRMSDLMGLLGQVVTLEDEWPMRVRVLQVLAPERRQLGTPGRAGAWTLVVPIMVSILDGPFRYESAAHLDTTRTWG